MKPIDRWHKNKLNDITVLLSFLLVCAFSLGLLAQVQHTRNIPHMLSVSDFMLYIHPFLLSGGVDHIVDLMSPLDSKKMKEVLNQVIDTTEGSLTPQDKVKLVVHLGSIMPDKALQNMVFEFLNHYESIFEKAPILYTLAQSNKYRNYIPLVIAWMNEHGNQQAEPSVHKALEFAVKNDDISTFTTLASFNVPFDDQQAQALLWRVVTTDKNPDFLDFLSQYTGIDVPQGAYTPLMIAVERRNIPLITKFIKLGANPNKVVDNATGSALQISLIKQDESGQHAHDYVEIEQLLRSAGARERTL